MLNVCNFIGHLGADPEVRSFQNGGKVCNLRLAVTERWKKDGEQQERTEWVPIAVFSDGLVGVVERYLRKGSKVFVRGQFRTRKWQDQSGADRFTSEIVLQGPEAKIIMLDGPQGKREPDGSQGHADAFQGDELDDSIPFATARSIW